MHELKPSGPEIVDASVAMEVRVLASQGRDSHSQA